MHFKFKFYSSETPLNRLVLHRGEVYVKPANDTLLEAVPDQEICQRKFSKICLYGSITKAH